MGAKLVAKTPPSEVLQRTHTQARVKDAERSTESRIVRLRDRCRAAQRDNPDDPMPGIVLGVLDLLGDKLP